jgi:hypothetical protein
MRHDTIPAFAFSLAAPAIWFAHFSALYGAETWLCLGAGGAGFRAAALALTTAALLGLAFVFLRAPALVGFLSAMSRLLTLLSVVAVLWTAVPAFLLTSC